MLSGSLPEYRKKARAALPSFSLSATPDFSINQAVSMKKSVKYRSCIADVRRVVVKIGTRVLVRETGLPNIRIMARLIQDMARLQKAGHEVLVVTSGAVGAGMEELGMRRRPNELADLQMAAAVGQSRLMSRYYDLFSKAGCTIGQVLLTHMDFHHKIRYTNARRTMEKLIRSKVIPIINENDVVADEEMKADMALGDNDLLASLVVRMVRADLLVILSTTDGVRQFHDKGSTRIPYIESITPSTYRLVSGGHSSMSKGGMLSKLQAARSVAQAGCMVVIADGRKPAVLPRILAGANEGTLILARGI
jgi:glutamate 5-kinase